MTDYTDTLPDDDRALQIMLSSCAGSAAHTPYDVAYIRVDEDSGVTLEQRTCYGNDAVPMVVWHARTYWFDLTPGTDAEWLREQLAEGEAARLIDRIVAGHSVVWNGSNMVGRLDEDAGDACERLREVLESAPVSDLRVVDAREWIQADMSVRALARTLREQGCTPETLLAVAESEWDVVIRGGIDAMDGASKDIFEEADIEAAQELLDAWDADEVEEAEAVRLYKAVFSRAPAAGENIGKAILGAINQLDAFAARRVIEVIGGESK